MHSLIRAFLGHFEAFIRLRTKSWRAVTDRQRRRISNTLRNSKQFVLKFIDEGYVEVMTRLGL